MLSCVVFVSVLAAAAAAAVVDALNPASRTCAAAGYGQMRVPAVTEAPYLSPDLLLNRRNSPSVCGYVLGIESDPWTCDPGNYCGIQTTLNAFGCCESSLSEGSLTGCFFLTQCLNSQAYYTICDAACKSNDLIGWCTDSTRPYCETYLSGTLTGFGCGTESGATYGVYSTFGTENYNTTTTTTTTTPVNSPFTTSQASPTTLDTTSSSAIPFTQSQRTSSANEPTFTVTNPFSSSATETSNGAGGASEVVWTFESWIAVLVSGVLAII
ncbi:hypothetical protein CLAIMM_06768 [Cladophialophora immunda]|nr:hypothetical protein CLAIMM_06768 [Cladophialophora immunda]